MTETGTETGVEVDVDLDAPVPCSLLADPTACSNPAEWVAITVCCGTSAPGCSEHRELLIKTIEQVLYMLGDLATCRNCGGKFQQPKWVPL